MNLENQKTEIRISNMKTAIERVRKRYRGETPVYAEDFGNSYRVYFQDEKNSIFDIKKDSAEITALN